MSDGSPPQVPSPETSPAFRGTPPSDKQLAKLLGARYALWQSVVAIAGECQATWRWAYSDATESWGQRAYLPGDRFFCSLSLREPGFEVSLNLKADEWDMIPIQSAAEGAAIDALREKALASGKDPAWVHLALEEESQLTLLSKLLFARGRRQEAPRLKKRKRR